MKYAAIAALMLASVSVAHAESFFAVEAGLGASSYSKTGNGIYYNEGFAHHTPTNAVAYRMGIVITPVVAQPRSFVPGVRFHADYFNFGSLNWQAQSPQDAADFAAVGKVGGYDVVSKSCLNEQCGQMSNFQSTGRIQAVALTVEPYWNLGSGWTIGAEVGPAIYRATWNTIATVETTGGTGKLGAVGSVSNLSASPALHVGAIVGASVSRGPWSVRYNYLFAPVHYGSADNNSPSGVKGVHMLTVNYTY